MTITELLRADHRRFTRSLRAMEAVLKSDRVGAAVKLRAQLEAYLPELAAHERIEEELLFPALAKAGGMPPGVAAMFQSGHQEIREKIRALREVLSLREAPLSRFVAGVDFLHVMREHMEEEERLLFPAAERILPQELLARLGGEAASRHGTGRAAQGRPKEAR